MKKIVAIVLLLPLLCGCTPGIKTTQNIDPVVKNSTSVIEKPKDIIAGGNFSEGLAFAYVTIEDNRGKKIKKSVYVDGNGKVVFEIPDGWFGNDFSEGYAVIQNIATEHNKSTYINKLSYGKYALIDKTGKEIFPKDKYLFIGKMSEGVIFTIRKEETYQGVEWFFDYLNSEGETVLRLPKEKVVVSYNDGDVLEYTDSTFFLDGVVLFATSSNLRAYNKNGELLYKRDSNPFGDELDISYGVYNRSTGEEIVKNGLSNVVFYDNIGMGCIRGRKNNSFSFEGLASIDTAGNVIARNEEIQGYYASSAETRYKGGDGYWIFRFENDFFGVVDKSCQLLFEPVKGALQYLGEGLFVNVTNNQVLNTKGEVVFTLKIDSLAKLGYTLTWSHETDNTYVDRTNYSYYHEGKMIVGDKSNRRFINKEGKILWNGK